MEPALVPDRQSLTGNRQSLPSPSNPPPPPPPPDDRLRSPPFMVLTSECGADTLQLLQKHDITFPFSKLAPSSPLSGGGLLLHWSTCNYSGVILLKIHQTLMSRWNNIIDDLFFPHRVDDWLRILYTLSKKWLLKCLRLIENVFISTAVIKRNCSLRRGTRNYLGKNCHYFPVLAEHPNIVNLLTCWYISLNYSLQAAGGARHKFPWGKKQSFFPQSFFMRRLCPFIKMKPVSFILPHRTIKRQRLWGKLGDLWPLWLI